MSVRQGTKIIGTDLASLKDIPTQVSGAQIPRVAGQEHAKVAIALMELMTNRRQHLSAKSYAVYLVPGIALLCGLLLIVVDDRRMVVGVALMCLGIAGLGFWKLLTTETATQLVAMTFGYGLWLSLWAYVGLAVAAGLCAVSSKRRAG